MRACWEKGCVRVLPECIIYTHRMTKNSSPKDEKKGKKYQGHVYIFYDYEMHLVFILFSAESYNFWSFLSDRNGICPSWSDFLITPFYANEVTGWSSWRALGWGWALQELEDWNSVPHDLCEGWGWTLSSIKPPELEEFMPFWVAKHVQEQGWQSTLLLCTLPSTSVHLAIHLHTAFLYLL